MNIKITALNEVDTCYANVTHTISQFLHLNMKYAHVHIQSVRHIFIEILSHHTQTHLLE